MMGVGEHTNYRDRSIFKVLKVDDEISTDLAMMVYQNKEDKYYFIIINSSYDDDGNGVGTMCAKSYENYETYEECIKIAKYIHAGNMTIIRTATEAEKVEFEKEQQILWEKHLENDLNEND